jgi:hypothetical protein
MEGRFPANRIGYSKPIDFFQARLSNVFEKRIVQVDSGLFDQKRF